MSDEQAQQQQQQRQQQMQQQGHHKSNKDNNTTTAAITPPQQQHQQSQQQQRKTNIHELRNQDYVSRLMAATPPYLYSAPVGPNNFFFSDMLRSLVQARNNENARNLQLQQSVLSRRPRKRSWSQHRPYYDHLRERKESEEKHQPPPQPTAAANMSASPALSVEKPLELTNKPFFHIANKYRNKEIDSKPSSELTEARKSGDYAETAPLSAVNVTAAANTGGAVDTLLQDTPPAASLPPQDLVLPPPPPVWYPPLYPPYGIDPLHFFIDLRVSGHIYDRKKENVSPLTSAENSNPPSTDSEPAASAIAAGEVGLGGGATLLNKHRQGSAFTVPIPRSNELKPAANDAINLTSSATANKFENYAKYYDFGETKENQPLTKTNANYMLQHLPRLYSHFAARDFIASNVAAAAIADNNNLDTDNKSEPDCDADSEGRASTTDADCIGSTGASGNRERDIDVEIIDSIRYRTDGECSSRCTSPDEASVTQID